MRNQPNEPRTVVGSEQDGEDPEFRTDTASEILRPGSHGGAGSPAGIRRSKSREIEDEMIAPNETGKPPWPGTEKSDDNC